MDVRDTFPSINQLDSDKIAKYCKIKHIIKGKEDSLALRMKFEIHILTFSLFSLKSSFFSNDKIEMLQKKSQ